MVRTGLWDVVPSGTVRSDEMLWDSLGQSCHRRTSHNNVTRLATRTWWNLGTSLLSNALRT